MAEAVDAVPSRKELGDWRKELGDYLKRKLLDPGVPEVLYCLYLANDMTNEAITPARLVEMSGSYLPPDSLGNIKAVLGILRENAFAYVSDDNKVHLTGSGEIVARGLGRVTEGEDLYKTLGIDEAVYAGLRGRLQRVDQIFQQGV